MSPSYTLPSPTPPSPSPSSSFASPIAAVSQATEMAAWDNMLDRFKEAGLLSRFNGQAANFSDMRNLEIMLQEVADLTSAAFARHPQVRRVLVYDLSSFVPNRYLCISIS